MVSFLGGTVSTTNQGSSSKRTSKRREPHFHRFQQGREYPLTGAFLSPTTSPCRELHTRASERISGSSPAGMPPKMASDADLDAHLSSWPPASPASARSTGGQGEGDEEPAAAALDMATGRARQDWGRKRAVLTTPALRGRLLDDAAAQRTIGDGEEDDGEGLADQTTATLPIRFSSLSSSPPLAGAYPTQQRRRRRPSIRIDLHPTPPRPVTAVIFPETSRLGGPAPPRVTYVCR